jgi:hypothetical protein
MCVNPKMRLCGILWCIEQSHQAAAMPMFLISQEQTNKYKEAKLLWIYQDSYECMMLYTAMIGVVNVHAPMIRENINMVANW